MNEWRTVGYSLPDFGMVHVIISNGNKRISKTYSQKGSFFNFMYKHGLLDDYFDIIRIVW